METAVHDVLRRQLSDRQNRLRKIISHDRGEDQLIRLLEQVDSALARLDLGDYARCLVCGGDIDDRDLLQNPLLEYCLCDLTPQQQRALELDLQLARQIQAGLLPDPDFVSAGWEGYFRYEPLGMVSGDFCDLWTQPGEPDTVYFAVGDVSGKGVAASLLMSHLQAAFRSLIEAGVPLSTLVERVNRQLLRASIPTHYATLACGRLAANGDVEIVNAGHCPPVIVRSTGIESIPSTGFPIGLLADRSYELNQFTLAHGDTLVLYTDGLTEAGQGEEFGFDRLKRVLAQGARGSGARGPRELVSTIRQALATFLGEVPVADDLTIMVVQRSHRGEA
jgi:sigma-B regulation protein RsbU (phosphoserine phosphatase)